MKKFSILLLLFCLSLIVAPRNSYGVSYCTPTYYNPTAACYTYGMDISQYRVAGESSTLLNDVTACSGTGYENMTSTTMTVTFMQSVSYTATINTTGGYAMDCQVWIDFNNNGTFEASESCGGLNAYSSLSTFSLTIPIGAATGTNLRMRLVTAQSGGYYPSMNPCVPYTYYFGDSRDYNCNIVALPACSGTVTGGTANTTLRIVCPSQSFTTSVTGGTAASGMTFQWQSSPDSATWSDISGATTFNWTTTESATTFYRRKTTCPSSSSTAFSSGVKVIYIGACYCTPTYTNAASSCTSLGINISHFQVNGESGSSINDVATCNSSGYLDRTALYDTFKQSVTYRPTLWCSGGYSLNAQTFIDWNDNGTFETTESVGGLNGYTSSGTAYNITIPVSAPVGMHRMRVVGCHPSGGSTYPSISSCPSPYSYGETRDYTIYIIALPACSGTPTGGRATSSVTLACPSTPFTLTDTGFSVAGALTFQWQSSSDTTTWTNITGATTATYAHTASSPLYYRCLVTCSTSGATTPSRWVFVNYLGICFCTPTYISAGLSCSTYNFALSRVYFSGEAGSTLNDPAACTGTGYQDMTGITAVDFMQVHTYSATLTPNSVSSGVYTLSCQIWIDFNDDGTFASSETIGGNASYSSSGPVAVALTIPFLTTGYHRMRVVQVYTGFGDHYPTLNPCTSGYYYGEARDYMAHIVPLPPCSGTPTAGTVASTTATACPSLSFTLSLVGSTIAGSLTWQWQSSPDSATWTSISGATTNTYSLTETSSLYYRCIINCTISGSADTTPGLLIPYFSYCYCIPYFSQASNSCVLYHFALDGLRINGEYGTSINDNAVCDGTGYRNRTSLSTTLMRTLSYTTTVIPSAAGTSGAYTLNNQIWIDFSDNGTFESSERVSGNNGYADAAPTTQALVIPATAATGSHRMRIVQGYSGTCPTDPSINPCPTTYSYGEARDYTVNIVPLPPCASSTLIPGTAISSTGTACPGIPFTLTDFGYGMASGLTFQWEVSNDSATWTPIAGATNPTHTLTQTGPKYYHCLLICTSGSTSATSIGVYVNYISYCYCTPSYTTGALSCGTYHMTISRNYLPGAVGTLLHDTTACNSTCYENLTGMAVSFFQGTTYHDSVSTAYSAGTMCAQVWIDYNNDGTFATSESVGGYNYYTSAINFNITIPASATLGAHRMRIVTAYAGSGYTYSSMDPCTYGYSLGDARDYTANIVIPGCTGTPTAGSAAATSTSGCAGYTTVVSLSGSSTGTGIQYQWQVSPDNTTWTTLTGATLSTYTTTIVTPKYFRAIVTCGTTTLSSTSSSVYCNVATPPSTPAGTYYTCSGDSILWSASPSGGTWTSASTSIASVNATSGWIHGLATGTSVITYMLSSGCYSSRTVVVNPSPATITGTPNVCVGSTRTLSDATSGGNWSSSNPSVASVDVATGVVYGLAVGTATISYTLPTGCAGSSPTTTVSFTVNPNPAAITGTTALCMGYPVTLSSATTGGAWSSSSSTVASVSGTTGSVTGMSVGSATITYTVTATGCKTTASVTVNPVIVPTLAVSATPSTAVCAGTSVTLTSAVTNPGTSPTYVWSVNGVIVSGATNYTYVPANGDVVKLWFASSATCAVPDSMSVLRTMSVNPVVTPAVTASTGVGDTVCLGSVVTLTATSTGGGSAPYYHWYVNSVPVGSTAGSYSYIPTNGDVVTVRVISNAPCRTADSGTFSRVLTVSPYVTPSVSIATAPGTTVCEGTLVTFTGTGFGGGTSPAFAWSHGGGTVGTASSYSYVPSNGDVVTVVYTSNFPCVTSATATDNVVMTVLPTTAPVGVVTVSPGYIIASGATATFTCTITSGGGSSPTYQWTINSVPVSGATNSTYMTSSLSTGSVVTCIVANTDPCSTVSTFAGITMVVSNATAGVGQVGQAAANVTVLPNPNNGVFTITGNLGGSFDEAVALEITDMLGQVIYRDNVKAVRGEFSHGITLNGKFANGMYLINVKSEHLNQVFHFVLEQ